MQRKDKDKLLIRKHKEEKGIWSEIRNLEWNELKPPVQRGFIRYFVLREDVARTKEASFFQRILDKINTRQWSYRKDFKKKGRRFGKKVYNVREQQLADVSVQDFIKNFSEREHPYFEEQLVHWRYSKKPHKVYRFTESWRFVLKVQPNMITKVRVKNLDLERRKAEVDKFFNYERRGRLWKLIDATHSWHRKPEEKYRSPFYNRSFASVLDEYWPDQQMKITFKNPRQNRGFCFCWVMLEVRTQKHKIHNLAAIPVCVASPYFIPFEERMSRTSKARKHPIL
ncbi:MAG: hypothetical protein JSS79_10205 [Bacteroidetes bacterium]|nr:hypothetical protein [Bacteroidota bacterium]